VTLIDSDIVDEHHSKAIQQLNQKVLPGGHRSTTLKFYDKLKALGMLAKYLGLYEHPQGQVNGSIEDEHLTDEELIQKLEAELVRHYRGQLPLQLDPSN